MERNYSCLTNDSIENQPPHSNSTQVDDFKEQENKPLITDCLLDNKPPLITDCLLDNKPKHQQAIEAIKLFFYDHIDMNKMDTNFILFFLRHIKKIVNS